MPQSLSRILIHLVFSTKIVNGSLHPLSKPNCIARWKTGYIGYIVVN